MSGSQSHADDEYPDAEATAAAEERMIILLFIRERAREIRVDPSPMDPISVEIRRHFTAKELEKLANEIEQEKHLQ